jgi:endoglucanase
MNKLVCFLAQNLVMILPLFPQSTIKINQLGYLINYSKYAWVNDVQKDSIVWSIWSVGDSLSVFSAKTPASQSIDSATRECVTRLDFSKFNKPGIYFIEVENVGVSFSFPVSDHLFNEVWKAGIKSYYFQRSGMNLEKRYAGIWARKAAHIKDARVYEGYSNGKIIEGEYRNCTGGWYDAGDFGKKIVPASLALYAFLKLAEMHPEKVRNAGIDIPNPYKGLPDFLAEAKWELDWFFTMQEASGAVHHLIVSPDFFYGPAQDDNFPRYITGISSTATADFAASMAMAAKVFHEYLPRYADSCLIAAEKAWKYLQDNPAIFPAGGYRDQEGIHGTGAYGDPNDQDERLWASAELYHVTGKKNYLDYFEKNCSHFPISSFGWWIDPHNYALYTMLLDIRPGKDPATINKLRTEIREHAEKLSRLAASNAYSVALTPDQYIWGSNSFVLNIGMELLIINEIFGTRKYTDVALQQLNYILGCNSLNLSFVSGYGKNAVKDPHQSINSYDSLSLAPPGFIPGGPNRFPEDHFLQTLIATRHPPPAKCYIDNHWSYASNEVCTCYNSGFIMLAGFFFDPKLK